MLFSIGLWRQCQPLVFPPIQASTGALRSVSPKSFCTLYKCQISSMHSSTRKTPQKRTQNISLHLFVNLKNVRVLAPPAMLFSIGLWRQCQPLVFPPIQASNGALRSVTHERRNVVIRVTPLFMGAESCEKSESLQSFFATFLMYAL